MGVSKHLTELIVRVADLAEAEGKLLRRVVARLGLGLALSLVGAALLFIGIVGVLGGVWMALRDPLGPAWASVLVGLLFVSGAGATFFAAARFTK